MSTDGLLDIVTESQADVNSSPTMVDPSSTLPRNALSQFREQMGSGQVLTPIITEPSDKEEQNFTSTVDRQQHKHSNLLKKEVGNTSQPISLKDPSITEIGSPGTNYRDDSNFKKTVTLERAEESKFKLQKMNNEIDYNNESV